MTIAEQITEKMKHLNYGSQVEILDFVEFIEAKKSRPISDFEREHLAEVLQREKEIEEGTARELSLDEFELALH